MKKLLIEFLGTFFLVLTIAMTFSPLAIASILMAWLYIGNDVSGSHYNPLVSLAMAIRGKLHWNLLPGYMAAQIVGGLAAFAATSYFHSSIALPQPALDITLLQALIVEIALSFVLALVVLVATTTKRVGHVYGFAIGFTIPALATLGAPISGGLFNPAIALGSAIYAVIVGVPVVLPHVAMYVGGALAGGALAAYAFKFFDLAD